MHSPHARAAMSAWWRCIPSVCRRLPRMSQGVVLPAGVVWRLGILREEEGSIKKKREIKVWHARGKRKSKVVTMHAVIADYSKCTDRHRGLPTSPSGNTDVRGKVNASGN